MNSSKSLIFLFNLIVISLADNVLDLIEFSQTSQQFEHVTTQACRLNDDQLQSLIAYGPIQKEQKYVLIRENPNDEVFIKQSLRPLANLGYQICIFDEHSSQNPSANITILIEAGHLIRYNGRHDVDTLVRFVANLEQRFSQLPYQTISSKLDKKAYEHVLEPKIIAYFPDKTAPGFAEFEKAAKKMSPNPQFFVVHDPTFASKFRLQQPGKISLVRRLEKSQLFYQSTSSSSVDFVQANEIIEWIQKNRGLVLHELKDTNLYDPELQDPNKFQLVAIGDKSSPLGLYFFKILTKTIQNISRENEMFLNPLDSYLNDDDEEMQSSNIDSGLKTFSSSNRFIKMDDIEIVWIDSIQFPNAILNLKNRYGQIDTSSTQNVWFGLIQSPKFDSILEPITDPTRAIWFNLSRMNLSRSDRQTDQENIAIIKEWILTVTNRLQSSDAEMTDGQNIQPKLFTLEPKPIVARPNGNFVLECRVPIGKSCSWLKDSKPQPIDGLRYRLANPNHNEDCSILITGADPSMDSGEWSCQIQQNPAHRSYPVLVQIQNTEL
uniref:Calsequestrin n=1 Tax=Sarcoptes scabiei TaxID=52283 RepID=A0A834RCZ8_SARSC